MTYLVVVYILCFEFYFVSIDALYHCSLHRGPYPASNATLYFFETEAFQQKRTANYDVSGVPF
jgi:hypothetical protein